MACLVVGGRFAAANLATPIPAHIQLRGSDFTANPQHLTTSALGPHMGPHHSHVGHQQTALGKDVSEDISVQLAKLAEQINQRTELAQQHISSDFFDLKKFVNSTADRTVREAFSGIEENLLPNLGCIQLSTTPGIVPDFTKAPVSSKLNKRRFPVCFFL